MTIDDSNWLELAKGYVESTEAYDKSVCTCIAKDGTARPLTSEEVTLVQRNARRTFGTLTAGFDNKTKQDFLKAIQNYKKQ